MPKWLWFLPVSCLTLTFGYFGLKQGQQMTSLSETEVINAVAGAYVEKTGGAMTDCFAYPSEKDREWLVVSCGTNWLIGIDRFGRTLWIDHTPVPDA